MPLIICSTMNPASEYNLQSTCRKCCKLSLAGYKSVIGEFQSQQSQMSHTEIHAIFSENSVEEELQICFGKSVDLVPEDYCTRCYPYSSFENSALQSLLNSKTSETSQTPSHPSPVESMDQYPPLIFNRSSEEIRELEKTFRSYRNAIEKLVAQNPKIRCYLCDGFPIRKRAVA